MPDRVLFDVNVLLDVIEHRQPHIGYSGPALQLAADRVIKGFICASSVDTLAFLIKRNSSSLTTHAILEDLLQLLEVAPLDGKIIKDALTLRWNDPEDAILYQSACAVGCTYIVSRNVRDFKVKDGEIQIITPKEMTRMINQ
jgi:predicted nucleic acid-binding protein